jgi:hypothetical protein
MRPGWPQGLLRVGVFLALGLTLGSFTLGPLTRARWGIIDDHEIAQYVGPSGRLPFGDIPRVLIRDTEVGAVGHVPRFRPTYYTLRLAESSLWGFIPATWYRARIGLYALSVVLVGWVVAARIGTVAGVGLLAWVLSGKYWVEVWGRLGAAESYGVFGGALWAMGVHLLWPMVDGPGPGWTWRRRVALTCFLVGNAVLVGAKENLLIVAIPNLLLALLEMRAGRTGGIRWWACLVSAGMAVMVAAPLAAYFSASGVDAYGGSVALRDRLAVLADGAIRPTAVHGAFIVALMVWLGTRIAGLGGGLGPSEAWRRLTSCLLVVSASALALLLSQIVLYNGSITPQTRYEFPAALAGPALLVATSVCVRTFLRRTQAFRTERSVFHVTSAVLLTLALLNVNGFREQREWSRQWMVGTRDFATRIAAAAATARARPEIPIIVISGRPLDFEPMLSVDRFLRQLAVSNPRFLVLDWQSSRAQWSALEVHLAPQVEQLARQGWLGYEPEASVHPRAPCFSIGLSHEPPAGCQSLGRLW